MGWESKIPSASGGGSGGSFEIAPSGNHLAVLVGLIDLGSHENTFNGESTGWKRKVFLVWELLSKRKKDGSPFYLGKEFTYSWDVKATLRTWVSDWEAKPLEAGQSISLSDYVGKLCLLTVINKPNRDGSRTYDIANSIGAVPEGITSPRKPTRPPLAWQIGETAEERAKNPPPTDDWLPFSFGTPLADVIRTSPEWNGQPVPKVVRAKPGNSQDGGVTDAARAIGAAQGDACEDEVTIF